MLIVFKFFNIAGGGKMLLYLFLAVGCIFMGIRDLRKLKAEIEGKFGEIRGN